VLASGHGAPLLGADVSALLRAFASRLATKEFPR
jgi:hypothetical protein